MARVLSIASQQTKPSSFCFSQHKGGETPLLFRLRVLIYTDTKELAQADMKPPPATAFWPLPRFHSAAQTTSVSRRALLYSPSGTLTLTSCPSPHSAATVGACRTGVLSQPHLGSRVLPPQLAVVNAAQRASPCLLRP